MGNDINLNEFICNNILYINDKLDDQIVKSEYEKYFEKYKNNFNIVAVNNLENGFKYFLTTKFKYCFLIISCNLIEEFILKFLNNIDKITFIPIIYILTDCEHTKKQIEERKFEKIKNQNIYEFIFNNRFYNPTLEIFIKLEKIEKFINFCNCKILKGIINAKIEKDINIKKNENAFTFEYIESFDKLILPFLFPHIINNLKYSEVDELIKFILNDCNKSNEILKLLSPLSKLTNIPFEISSKFLLRTYTFDSEFYFNLNSSLRDYKNMEHYSKYIKLMYKGLKIKSFKKDTTTSLYRGSSLSYDELCTIDKYILCSHSNLPNILVFSKVFLSFSKKKETALKFVNNYNKNIPVLFELIVNPNEKNESIVYNIKTYDWSKFPNEDEILFLPYSTFSIKNIKYERFKIKCRDKENKISYLNVMGKIIQLEYIGKYIEKINIVDYSDEDILKLIERIKQSKFYNEILNSKLIENQSDGVIKDFIDEFFRKKKKMNSNTNFDNQNENKFNFPQVPVEKRFENFINNKNNNHPYINNIQYNNNYNINNNNNNNLNFIMENNVY
jgi:hypothetical protein